MKKKLIFSSIVLGLILILTSISVYAYFNSSIKEDKEHDLSLSLTSDSIVEINSISDFYSVINYSDSTSYNDSSESSKKDDRKTLQLNIDIVLTADAVILADCHINLNNHTINIGSFNLTIKNPYCGKICIYNSPTTSAGDTCQITATTGDVIIDSPHAHVAFDVELVRINGETSTTFKPTIINESRKIVTYSAMNLVLSNILNYGSNNFYSTILDESYINYSKVYTYTDLFLIYNYYSYKDLSITYESNNSDILTSNGRVVDNSSDNLITFTITIVYGNSTLVKELEVNIVSEASYNLASVNLIQQYLYSNYYGLNENNEEKYIIKNALILPLSDEYFGTELIYKVTVDSTTYSTNDETVSEDYFLIDTTTNYVTIYLDASVTSFTITSGTSSVELSNIEAASNKLIDDDYSYAVGIVSSLYGNTIITTDSTGGGYEINHSDLLTSPEGYSRLDQSSKIKYELVNNSNGTYVITSTEEDYDTLAVASGKVPQIEETVYLKVTFTFKENASGEKEEVIIQIPIMYNPATTSDEQGFEWFSPYYSYFNRQFNTKTNNYTYNSFDLPVAYRIGTSYYPTYDILIYKQTVDTNGDPVFEKVTLGDLFTVTYGSLSNVTLESLISSTESQTTTLDSIVTNSLSVMNININPYHVAREDETYVVAYIPVTASNTSSGFTYSIPKFENVEVTDDITGITTSVSQISSYTNQTTLDGVTLDINTYRYISTLTIPGIVRVYDENKSVSTNKLDEAFLDTNFYETVFGILHPELVYSEGSTFILSARLGQSIDEIDLKSLYTAGSSFKGIDLLTGLKKIDLSGCNITALTGSGNWINEVEYISNVTNLVELNLSNTGLYDQLGSNLGLPTGSSNNFLTTLSNLNNLEILDLSNNQIYSFSALSSFTNLKEVNVGGNNFTVTYFSEIMNLLSFLDDIMTNMINSIYGSSGSTNQATFAVIKAKGVNVISDSGEFTLSNEVQLIVNALTSLEYQDKLDKNLSLKDTILASLNNEITDLSTNKYGLTSIYTETNAEDTAQIQYTLSKISFNEVEGSDTEFVFRIQYQYIYRYRGTNNRYGDWSTSADINYDYTYSVLRY